jgi:uncharacterized membrane protein
MLLEVESELLLDWSLQIFSEAGTNFFTLVDGRVLNETATYLAPHVLCLVFEARGEEVT